MIGSKAMTVVVACIICMSASWVNARSLSEPVVDTGLSRSTPFPDPDLVVVRERVYGASGVDLTPYGIGTGSDDFVQSIYFRLYPANEPGQVARFVGTVTFPAGTRILGFITSGAWLGSSSPGSPYTQSDALFAVSASPDDYATPGRGFDPGSGPGALEFLCQINERSFLFGLDVSGGGTDDFRVILDYGSGYQPGLTFELNLSTEPLGTVNASSGIRLGGTGGTSPGEGDYGEVTHLMGTPLTTDVLPVASTTPPVAGGRVIYLARETSGDPVIDALDAGTHASIPSMIQVPPPFQQPVRAISFGDDGLLYAIGNETGLAAIDTLSGSVTNIGVPDLPGLIQRMAVIPGDSRLFILRHTDFPALEDAWIDTYDTATGVFTAQFATFPTNLLPFPVDLIGTLNGRLYALGTGNGFHEVNTSTGAVTPQVFVIPEMEGDYVRGTADPRGSLVYLLRDTSGPTIVDSLNVLTGDFHDSVFTLPAATIPDAGAMIVDNDGMLWVFGKNGGTMGFDPSNPAASPFYETTCLDFAGTTNYAAILRSPREVSSSTSARPLYLDAPQAGLLRISFEDLGDPGLRYNVYSGTIGSWYSHAPTVCHDPGTPGAPGYLYVDVPVPGTATYYFVTASSRVYEGTAGLAPIVSPSCGPTP